MKPIFERGPSLPLRLFFAVLCSVGLMALDKFTDSSTQLRSYLTALVSPLYYVANLPQALLSDASAQFSSHQRLLEENQKLRETLLRQNTQVQRFQFLQQENDKLRSLLGSVPVTESKRLVAEVLAVYSHPFSNQIVINKGSKDGVVAQQPLLDDLGVLGQIVSVGPTSSRALLISDTTHAISMRIERNGDHVVAEGMGQSDQLRLMHLPHSADIQQGDKLLTSGLDGIFPEGYPVAEVVRINKDAQQPFLQVYARPYAQLDRIRYVLLVWPKAKPEIDQQIAPPEADTAAVAGAH
ncbi:MULTISPECIES: rod shape-determining protein MreC [Rheinheimera]|uniref:Cell shape-determining protein MreC n=1 Tax=Rheinheimera marina TaxID=1774958 RepID=A0ABV9JIU7_9GAMM